MIFKRLSGVFCVAAFFLFFLSHSRAASFDQFQNAQEYLDNKGEVYLRFWLDDINALSRVGDALSVDQIEGRIVYAYANREEFTSFSKLGYHYEILEHPGDQVRAEMSDYADFSPRQGSRIDKYPTYGGYITMLKKFQNDYPDLCKVSDLGKSVNGRHNIMLVRISDNVNSDNEPEPEFYSTGTIHGNETEGFVLALCMINHLLQNYGKDDQVTRIVDSSIVWFSPLVNPDGLYAKSDQTIEGCKRTNANGKDLNRDYPCPYAPWPSKFQAETKAVMNFEMKHNISMYVDFHGGIVMLLYPWSFTKNKTVADKKWWDYVFKMYVDNTKKENSGYLSKFGPAAITLYEAKGTTKDWMTYFRHSRGCTMELWKPHTIPENKLKDYWRYNRQAFLDYIEQVRFGIRGIVTDSLTDKPIGAKVFIKNFDKDSSWVYANSDLGDYYRLIFAGSYDVTFSHPDYHSRTIKDVTVVNNKATALDVRLMPKVVSSGNAPFIASSDIKIITVNTGVKILLNNDISYEEVKIYNVSGELIQVIPAAKNLSVWWDGCSKNGKRVSKGNYIFKICSNTGKNYLLQHMLLH